MQTVLNYCTRACVYCTQVNTGRYVVSISNIAIVARSGHNCNLFQPSNDACHVVKKVTHYIRNIFSDSLSGQRLVEIEKKQLFSQAAFAAALHKKYETESKVA